MSDRKAEFRRVIQNLTAYLEHSNYERPFRFVIDYDPEREEVDTRLQEKMKMSCRKELPDDKARLMVYEFLNGRSALIKNHRFVSLILSYFKSWENGESKNHNLDIRIGKFIRQVFFHRHSPFV